MKRSVRISDGRRRAWLPDTGGSEFSWINCSHEAKELHSTAHIRATRCASPDNFEKLTHLESRVTVLGYVQRGGMPCATDRILATRLATAFADLIKEGKCGVMVTARRDGTEPVPLVKWRQAK